MKSDHRLYLYNCTGGVTDERVVLDVTRSEYATAVASEFVSFGGVTYRAVEARGHFLSIHPYAIRAGR